MRLLVLSDSHRDRAALFEAIDREPSAEIVYFLGDGYNELLEAQNVYRETKAFIAIKGNCDFMSPFTMRDIRTVEGKKILATHGYAEGVKYGLSNLLLDAQNEHCDIALFGHTHIPCCSYENGIYIFNPGSLMEDSYGVIDILPSGILCANKTL